MRIWKGYQAQYCLLAIFEATKSTVDQEKVFPALLAELSHWKKRTQVREKFDTKFQILENGRTFYVGFQQILYLNGIFRYSPH